MSIKKTLGGDRLGSGNKQKVEMHGFERSTFDLGYIWRSTMSPGTLVPFMKMVAKPGDTFDIDLNIHANTHPTLGPLFGSYKIQLDVLTAAIRLYQGQLHNNKLGIGMNMAAVKLPIIEFEVPKITPANITDFDNSQVNPSSIFKYLGISGGGIVSTGEEDQIRTFNAVPFLMYWDIYKNYYANKQEEIGAVVHNEAIAIEDNVTQIQIAFNGGTTTLSDNPATPTAIVLSALRDIIITTTSTAILEQIVIHTEQGDILASELGTVVSQTALQTYITYNFVRWGNRTAIYWGAINANQAYNNAISVVTFDLNNIDTMRERILAHSVNSTPFIVTNQDLEPYSLPFQKETNYRSRLYSQEGLACKTYQSDLFNNWLSTDWIDGAGGINEITAVDTSSGEFTLDALLLNRKVYDMLNRIAVSGGSYQDWQDAVYAHEGFWIAESPVYEGGLIKELVFQEVVSNSESDAAGQGSQPLGTLAGKGVLGQKHKGGRVTIKVNELSYVMGIVSITPRVDYSQGNDWDVHLMTIDDFHKPPLDQIGFQELITDQMAFWDTQWDNTAGEWVTRSAGKQPAWINYMTAVNKTYGNFAIESNEMFMTLNRRYTPVVDGTDVTIEDLTTYIDPSKYNFIFAQTSLDSQNFWMQIAVDITARRKQSSKLMPNI